MSQQQQASMQHLVRAYFDGIVASDVDALLGLFAADAVMSDPVGTPEHLGHEGVARFHKGLHRAWTDLAMTVDEVFVRGTTAAVRWSAKGTSTTGKEIAFDGIDVIHANEAGRIARLEGYWDLEGVIAQM
jgi:steroid delta-isomerase